MKQKQKSIVKSVIYIIGIALSLLLGSKVGNVVQTTLPVVEQIVDSI